MSEPMPSELLNDLAEAVAGLEGRLAGTKAALKDALGLVDRLCHCIGTIEDDDHWKALDAARKLLLTHGWDDPTPYLPKP